MVDVREYDYSVFYDGIGITINWASRYRSDGKYGYRIRLWKDGSMVHETEMYSGPTADKRNLITSAVAFMTDYGVCESEEILEIWYNDPRIEMLGYIGYDLEEADAETLYSTDHFGQSA